MHRHQLLARFCIANMVLWALAGIAFAAGWGTRIVEADASYLSLVILGVFAVGWLSCLRHIVRISRALDGEDAWLTGPERTMRAIELEHSAAIVHVRHIANTLVILGLIGTVIGFILAFQNLDPTMVGDADSAGRLVAGMVSGISVALYTTLAGAVTSVWLMFCYRMLETGASRVVARMFRGRNIA